jgi:hypothetical protein
MSSPLAAHTAAALTVAPAAPYTPHPSLRDAEARAALARACAECLLAGKPLPAEVRSPGAATAAPATIEAGILAILRRTNR